MYPPVLRVVAASEGGSDDHCTLSISVYISIGLTFSRYPLEVEEALYAQVLGRINRVLQTYRILTSKAKI